VANGAKALVVDGAAARVERQVDGGREVYALPLPAVVGVKEGINLPRYPTMKGRLASKKLAVERIAVDPAAGGQRLVSLHTPVEQASATVVLGRGADAAAAVVDLFTEIGVLR
jgi:electron transfer flavoprotein beta subunit